MAFKLPTFNITCNVWHSASYAPHIWPLPAPDLSPPCNLSAARGRNVIPFLVQASGTLNVLLASQLLVGPKTDIRGRTLSGWNGDLVECPAGSGRFYTIGYVEDVARGFQNEYRMGHMYQVTSIMITLSGNLLNANELWPQPTP